MGDHESVLGVSIILPGEILTAAKSAAEEFALLEASYAITRLLQTFADFEYDPAQEMPAVGEERQDVTLVLSSGDGCWIRAQPYIAST
jgi:hypothetical protein